MQHVPAGREMAEQLLQPSTGPRDRDLSERQPDVLSQHCPGSHKVLAQSRAVASPLILLLTDKSHPVYSGAGAGPLADLRAQLGQTTRTGFVEREKTCTCLHKPFGKRFPPSLLMLQPHSNGPRLARQERPSQCDGKGQSHVGRRPGLCPHQKHSRCPSALPGSSPGAWGVAAPAPCSCLCCLESGRR